jgi:hypothetical protein
LIWSVFLKKKSLPSSDIIMGLHNKPKKVNLAPREGQRGLLCSNKEPIRCPSLGVKTTLSEEEKESFKILLKDLAKIFINKHLEDYD